MSKKILSIGLTIVGVALMAIPGVGTALGLGAIALAGTSITVGAIVGLGLTIAGSLLLAPPKPKALSTGDMGNDRLTATLVPTSPRKIWLGQTAGGTDVAYQAFTGSNQEYLEMIVVHASHAVQSIDELWLDNEKAESGGTIQGRYVGYLTVEKRTLGTNANGIAIDGTWTSSCTLTGCAYSHYKFKLTGNSSTAQSPFASGVTSRMTVRGKGAKVYDPRLDSTVAGGSGSQRANDQTTWAWNDNASRNPALQELFYELGWRINGKLAVGKGVPPARIDLASYAVSANACDESVALNGGGTEPRYRSDAVISEGDDPSAVRDNFCASMNSVLRDAGGQLALNVLHNDLATPVTPFGKTAFDEDDVIGEMQWDQTPDLTSSFNVVRGRRIDPSDNALYQPVEFPEVSLTSLDGIDRIDTVDYPLVQSNGQAQRLAKQRLERGQYQGRLSFTGKPSFWGLNVGDVFPLSHQTFGWSGKLFRCAGQKISREGPVEIVAVEENAAIYQWDNNEAAPVVAGTPVVYDPLNSPILLGIAEAATTGGASVSMVFLYKRAASAPAVPSTTSTFTFATAVLTGFNNGWSQSIPTTDGNPLYVTVATATNSGAPTDTIAAGEWATPVIMAQDGTSGSSAIQAATVFLYKRASSTPAVPSATATYTFATGVLSGITNGWSQSVPTTNGNPCYVTTATALVAAPGTTDSIATGEWATPAILAQDGAAGSNGTNGSNGSNGSNGTDALSVSSVPEAVTVPTTGSGAPKSAVPGFQLTVLQGASDITASATYSFTSSGLTSVVNAGSGAFTVAGFSADSGYVEVTVNSLVKKRVTYTKTFDGVAFNSQEDTTITNCGTSYTDVADVTLLAGPSGSFDVSYNIDALANGSSSVGLDAYVEYSLNGGSSWSTLSGSGSVSGSVPVGEDANVFNDIGFTGSSISLSSKINVMFRVMMKRTTSGTFATPHGNLLVQWGG